MKNWSQYFFIATLCSLFFSCASHRQAQKGIDTSKEEVMAIIQKVNGYWQANNVPQQRAFWDVAAYHTGNMEAYFLTKNEAYRKYSEAWAEHNDWKGAKSNNRDEWKYTYGEKDEYVLFGDWQICFQTYADLYTLAPDEKKIARAKACIILSNLLPIYPYLIWFSHYFQQFFYLIKTLIK